ncbi:MAG: adenylyltransferase/cytidyltransferase family protein [bacterium]|nr:adenylyltransferase/cytidyltransferase family protein [bacterium]
MNKDQKTVMAFGVFDVLHNGHRHFLKEAKKLGQKLVVAVAPDEAVLMIKNRLPHESLTKRIENLQTEKLADVVVSGDPVLGDWHVIKSHKPDVIALGYDQKELELTLSRFLKENGLKTRCVFIKPYSDDSLHSSIIRKKM